MTDPAGWRVRARALVGSGALAASARWPRQLHRGWPGATAAASAYVVYRARNSPHVARLVADLGPSTDVHLHALDEVSEALAGHTRSRGPGGRMELIDRLLTAHPPRAGHRVLICDDDVVFAGRDGGALVGLTEAAGLDIAMPAHARGSHWTFRVTLVRPFSTARLTAFVEVGPLVVLSPRALSRVQPLFRDAGMGWGLDVAWSTMRTDEGMVLGVVDATPVRHLGAVGSAYEQAGERERLDVHARAAGVDSAYDLAHDLGPVWRPWQARAPWVDDVTSGGRGG